MTRAVSRCVLTGLGTTAALAQFAGQPPQQPQTEPVVASCTFDDGQNLYVCLPGADVRSQSMLQSTLLSVGSVRDVLSMQFFPVSGASEGVALLGYAADDDGTDGAFVGFESAEYVPVFSVWGDLSGAYSRRTSASAGFDGGLISGAIGIDRQFDQGSVVGVFATAESSDYATSSLVGAGVVKGQGAGIGVYAGQLLGENVFANVTGRYQRLDNNFQVGATGASYGSDVLDVSASLTGYYQFDMFRLSPNATVAYIGDWQEGYVETSGAVSPARRSDVGVLSFGIEGGHTFFTPDGRSIEPWLSAGVDWTFLNRIDPNGPASPDPVAALDVRLGAGVNLALSDTASLSLRGDVSGLTTPGYVVVSGGGQLAVRF